MNLSTRRKRLENIFIGAVILIWILAVFPPIVTAGDAGNDQNNVVFEDNFTSDALFSEWPRKRSAQDDRSDLLWPADGVYHIRTSDALFVLAPRPEKIGDVSVEVDATVNGDGAGQLANWGTLCRATFPATNHYYLGLLSNGRPIIVKRNAGETSVLAAGNPGDTVNKKTNRIRGDCVGTKLILYANDRTLLEVEDGEFTSGGVGLYVESADILFGNFQVSKPPR